MSKKPWFEAAFGAHYPLLYRHRDLAEAERCLQLLPQLAPLDSGGGAPVLDLGCGDGRHLAWLARSGVRALGLDLSAHLLARAKERLSDANASLVRGDMRCLPWADQSFAAVLSLFTAFGYFGSPAANSKPVAEIARVLIAGGHWFLDYFDSQQVVQELGDGQPRTRERVLEYLHITETRRYDSETRQVHKDVQLQAVVGQEKAAGAIGIGPDGLCYAEQVAVFTIEELDGMARDHGLFRVAAAGDYHGAELGQGSRWILVYRKEQTKSV